jgi:hypothetical protein
MQEWMFVARIRPIPKKLLPHSSEYERFAGEGRNGPTYDVAVSLKNIRIEPTTELSTVTGNENERIQLKSKLFFDSVNSSPMVDWKEKSLIHFNNKEYFVQSIAEHYTDNSKIHHWEIGLI